MRVDQLQFEYDEEIFCFVSGLDDIDIVIQPIRTGFRAEVIDGTVVHELGDFVSERWAKVAALEKAKAIIDARHLHLPDDTLTGGEETIDVLAMFVELLLRIDTMETEWRTSQENNTVH